MYQNLELVIALKESISVFKKKIHKITKTFTILIFLPLTQMAELHSSSASVENDDSSLESQQTTTTPQPLDSNIINKVQQTAENLAKELDDLMSSVSNSLHSVRELYFYSTYNIGK